MIRSTYRPANLFPPERQSSAVASANPCMCPCILLSSAVPAQALRGDTGEGAARERGVGRQGWGEGAGGRRRRALTRPPPPAPPPPVPAQPPVPPLRPSAGTAPPCMSMHILRAGPPPRALSKAFSRHRFRHFPPLSCSHLPVPAPLPVPPLRPSAGTASKPTKGNPRQPKPTQAHPRPPKATQGNPRPPKSTQGHPRPPKATQGNPRQPKATQGNPRQPKPTRAHPRQPKAAQGQLGTGEAPAVTMTVAVTVTVTVAYRRAPSAAWAAAVDKPRALDWRGRFRAWPVCSPRARVTPVSRGTGAPAAASPPPAELAS